MNYPESSSGKSSLHNNPETIVVSQCVDGRHTHPEITLGWDPDVC